jgi:hypothetical protein
MYVVVHHITPYCLQYYVDPACMCMTELGLAQLVMLFTCNKPIQIRLLFLAGVSTGAHFSSLNKFSAFTLGFPIKKFHLFFYVHGKMDDMYIAGKKDMCLAC